MSKITVKIALFIILLMTTKCYAQEDPWKFFDFWGSKSQKVSLTPVVSIDTSTYPLTPYGNGWLVFNGTSNRQFARTSDLSQFEFIYSQTDSFRITARLKIKSYNKPMWILGKYDGNNGSWILGFNSNSGNTLEFYHTKTGWKNIKVLTSGDTNWYKIDIVGNRIDSTLKLYYNDTLASTTTAFFWASGNVAYSLAIGHASVVANYADPTTGNSSQATHFFHGYLDYLYIHKYKNGVDSAGLWNFNEGGGQQMYDSITYLSIDASTPDGFRPGSHFMNGVFGSRDSQDVTFSKGVRKDNGTTTLPLGTGLWNWSSSFPAYIQGFTNGLCIFDGNVVPSTTFNRVNVTDGVWTNNTDTASDIAKYSGITWSKIGTNGSLFPGGSVTQVKSYYDSVLFAGGSFTNVLSANGDYVLRYNNVTNLWDTCAKGFNNAVYCFSIWNGKIIAGGDFSASGSTTITSSVAQWNDGSWSAVGTNDIGGVWSLEPHNGVLWAGTTQGVYYLNGTTWTLVDAVGGSIIYCLESFKGDLWYGGSAGKIGKATTSGITSMGTLSGFTGDVIEFTEYGNDLYIGGSFYRIVYNGVGVVCNKLARWNGAEYSTVNYGYCQRLEDLAIWTYNGTDYLIVTGDFYWSDGIAYNNINMIPLN